MPLFSDVFPPSIYPAALILSVVALRLWAFIKYRDFMQLGRALPEFILGSVFAIDAFFPFATINRVNLLRNTIMLLFSIELFYQVFITPKLRRLNNVGK